MYTEEQKHLLIKEKVTKKEIQMLRTKLNMYKKCIDTIVYRMDNTREGIYDYGEASENTIEDIKEIIQDCKQNVQAL